MNENMEKESFNELVTVIKMKLLRVFCISLLMFYLFLIVVVVAQKLPWCPLTVNGTSMEPTLLDNDFLIAETDISNINRFDIITFVAYDGTLCIKRVVGMPGETIQIKDERIYIDGEELQGYVFNKGLFRDDHENAKEPFYIPEGCYFVLGDNTEISLDSRFRIMGPIPHDAIRTVVPLEKQ